MARHCLNTKQLPLKAIFAIPKFTCAAGLICLASFTIVRFMAGEVITSSQYLASPLNPRISFCDAFAIPHAAWDGSTSPEQLFDEHLRNINETILYFDHAGEDEDLQIQLPVTGRAHYVVPSRRDVDDTEMYVSYCYTLNANETTRSATSYHLNVASRDLSNAAIIAFHPGELPRSALYLDSPAALTRHTFRPTVAYATVVVSWSEYHRLSRPEAPCSDVPDIWSCTELCRLQRAARDAGCVPFFAADLLNSSTPACTSLDQFMDFYDIFNVAQHDCACPEAACTSTPVSLVINVRREERFSPQLSTLMLFQRQGVTRAVERPAVTWGTFLAELGGNLGLLLGVSALTIVDALEAMLESMLNRAGGRKTGGRAAAVGDGDGVSKPGTGHAGTRAADREGTGNAKWWRSFQAHQQYQLGGNPEAGLKTVSLQIRPKPAGDIAAVPTIPEGSATGALTAVGLG